MEFMEMDVIRGLFKLDVFSNMKSHIGKYFKNPRLRELLEFPVLFLGALPQNTPALYSLMNYGDIKLGTWYPRGGMHKIVEAMYALALELGVQFSFSTNVVAIDVEEGVAKNVMAGK
jgi:phytoene desaturase